MSTIYRRIRSFGLRSYRLFCVFLWQVNIKLQDCSGTNNKTDKSGTMKEAIVFNNESRFCCNNSEGRVEVRRPTGQRQILEFAQRRDTALTQGIMVWEAIRSDGRSCLVFIKGTLNARQNIDTILELVLPFIEKLPGAVFQQDNARHHTAKVTTECLTENNVNRLFWPATSPELNSVEHVWDMVDKRLRRLPHPPNNLGELRQQFQIAWEIIISDITDEKNCKKRHEKLH